MANTVFALDIHDDLVVGVVVTNVDKTSTVTACGIAEVGSRLLKTAIAEVVEQVGFVEGPCRVNLGAEHFFYRNLHFPFSDKNKIAQIIPGELAENSPFDAGKMLFDFLLANKKGKDASVIAAMAERSFLVERLELLKRLSVDPEILGISGVSGAALFAEFPDVPEDYIFLDIGFHKAVLVLVIAGQIALVRPLVFDAGMQAGFRMAENRRDVSPVRADNLGTVIKAFARSVRQTILVSPSGLQGQQGLPLYLAGPVGCYPGLDKELHSELGMEVRGGDMRSRPFLKIEDEAASRWHTGSMDRALALALISVKGGRDFNFRKDELRKKGSIQDYRRFGRLALLPLMVGFILVIGYCWHDHAALRKQQLALEGEIHKIFSETLPDVTRIVSPVQQLQVRIKETKEAYAAGGAESSGLGMLALLAEISGRIPATLEIRISKMVADQNDVQLKGTTENFNIVDSVQKELEKSPFFKKVEISSANLSAKGGAVDFELKLEPRR